jgi:hypothetical protein
MLSFSAKGRKSTYIMLRCARVRNDAFVVCFSLALPCTAKKPWNGSCRAIYSSFNPLHVIHFWPMAFTWRRDNQEIRLFWPFFFTGITVYVFTFLVIFYPLKLHFAQWYATIQVQPFFDIVVRKILQKFDRHVSAMCT